MPLNFSHVKLGLMNLYLFIFQFCLKKFKTIYFSGNCSSVKESIFHVPSLQILFTPVSNFYEMEIFVVNGLSLCGQSF